MIELIDIGVRESGNDEVMNYCIYVSKWMDGSGL